MKKLRIIIQDCINSSKVYCKYFSQENEVTGYKVLIVAKCIVNLRPGINALKSYLVLIVAKCIVNIDNWLLTRYFTLY